MSRISRRRWLQGLTGTTGATGVTLASGWLSPESASGQDARSRVVVVTDGRLWTGPGWTDADLDANRVRTALERALVELTGQADIGAAMVALFPKVTDSQQRYGIKVNCVNADLPTHPVLVGALADLLVASGARAENILVFDRVDDELAKCGFIANETRRYRVVSALRSGYGTEPLQLSDDVVGLSRIVTDGIDDLISVPVLKNHEMAGVTLSLKNHFGSIDHPDRLHGRVNDGCPGIAELNAQPWIVDKTRLVLIDAMFGTYESGLAARPDFAPMSLLAATDPVAADSVGRDIIDKRRAAASLPPVRARHIELASEKGLGRAALSSIDRVDVVFHPVEEKRKPWEPTPPSSRCEMSRGADSTASPASKLIGSVALAGAVAMVARRQGRRRSPVGS